MQNRSFSISGSIKRFGLMQVKRDVFYIWWQYHMDGDEHNGLETSTEADKEP